MKYTCPKCGKHLELSVETLIANEYKTVCPQCLTQLEIVGDYAYVPLDDGSLELRRQDEAPQQPAEAIEAFGKKNTVTPVLASLSCAFPTLTP